jgi:hypothetical protein
MKPNEYDYSENAVQAIMDWAESTKLPKEVMLSEAEHVYDTSIYVRANINDIKAHYPDPFYNPSIDRLYRLKEIVEATE